MVKLWPVKLLFGAFITALCFVSCQRVIDVNISNSSSPKLVIEANLTDMPGIQKVTISRTVPYNSSNVFPPVSGATVTLNEGASGKFYRLSETVTPGTYTLIGYKGKTLSLYTLNVTIDNKLYTASAIMPIAVNLDSLTLSAQVFGSKQIKTVSVNYRDPGNVANQYKYVMYVNGVQIKRIFTENDNLTDGRAVSTSLYQREVDLNKGDRVDVDMQCIDLNMFNYWDNLGNQGGNGPQNSATPANPPSNFFNSSVLGYFSAHTIQRKTVIIP